MRRTVRYFAIPALVMALSSGAFAQAAPPSDKACAGAMGQEPNQNLSNKLQGSQGVICPPNVDPAIKAPTPHTGDTPVIPPPNPGAQPR
jgi:hypothetical protein